MEIYADKMQPYSNIKRIVPFCRSFQVHFNGIWALRVAQMGKKLWAIEILDIYAWVHYTAPTINYSIKTIASGSATLMYPVRCNFTNLLGNCPTLRTLQRSAYKEDWN